MKLLLLAIFLASCTCIRLRVIQKSTLDLMLLMKFCEFKREALEGESCSKISVYYGSLYLEQDCRASQNSGEVCYCDENCYSGKCQSSKCVETSA